MQYDRSLLGAKNLHRYLGCNWTLGGNKAAAQVPSTAMTESLAERRSAAAPAVFGTPLLTSHFVNLTMLTNAQSCSGDPDGN